MRAVSFTVCWSFLIIAYGTLFFRRIRVFVSRVVLSELGLEIRLSISCLRVVKRARLRLVRRLFLFSTLISIFSIRRWFMFGA